MKCNNMSTNCSFAEDYALVYWPEEDCVNAISVRKIIEPCPPVLGGTCTVMLGKQKYSGVVVEIGTYMYTYHPLFFEFR